ncbi:MAG TPA: hypothetical protein VGE77_07995 [Nocardioides sp.]
MDGSRGTRSRLLTTTVGGVLLAAALQGCGADETAGVQEAEAAWIDGVVNEVLLPTGALHVAVTSVLDGPVQGSEGEGPFVGVRWQVVPRAGTSTTQAAQPVEVVAVVDGERLDLGAEVEESDARLGGGVLVGVPGGYDLDDLRVEIGFDGVVQTLAPWSGDLERGEAEVLYEDVTRSWQTAACPELVPADVVVPDPPFATCETDAVTVRAWTPETGWAEPGTLWWTVRLTSRDVASAPVGPPGAEASWFVVDVVASDVTLDGVAPSDLRPGFQGTDDQFAGAGLTGAVYTFAGPAELPTTPEGATLRLEQTYSLDSYDDVPPPDGGVRVSAEIPIGPVVALPDDAEGDA